MKRNLQPNITTFAFPLQLPEAGETAAVALLRMSKATSDLYVYFPLNPPPPSKVKQSPVFRTEPVELSGHVYSMETLLRDMEIKTAEPQG